MDSEVEQVAWRFWSLLGEGRAEDAVSLLADDGVYWVGLGGARDERPMVEMKDFFRTATAAVPMSFSKLDALVSGERVALEVESYADTPCGVYNNHYCFVMTVRDGRIVRVHEYLDTSHAAKVLIPQLRAANRP